VKAKLEAIQCQLLRGDAGKVMTNAAAEGKKFDLILLDPPFGQGWLAKILPVCRDVLSDDGYVYVEAEFPLEEQSSDPEMQELLCGWQVIRADKAGSVYFHILQRNILQHNAHENQA
jgi:16S rRNA G966 N2-methylase RsmD